MCPKTYVPWVILVIKALEKYKSIVQNFSYLYGAVLIQNLVSLVLTFYLVRALSETQYAEYSLILAYINIFASFSLTGLGEAVMQSTARKKIGIYLNAQKAMLLASTISAIIFIALAYFHKLSNDHSEALYLSMAAAAILFPFYKGLTIWKNFKNGKQEFKQLSIINVSSSVITNFLIIYLLIIDISESYIPLIIIYLLIPSLINVYMFFNDYFHHNIKNN